MQSLVRAFTGEEGEPVVPAATDMQWLQPARALQRVCPSAWSSCGRRLSGTGSHHAGCQALSPVKAENPEDNFSLWPVHLVTHPFLDLGKLILSSRPWRSDRYILFQCCGLC